MATNINPHNARMLSREVRRAEDAGGGSSGASIAVLMAIVGAEHLLRAKKTIAHYSQANFNELLLMDGSL